MSRKQATLENSRAEQALIGGLLKSPDSFWQIHNQIRADHFAKEEHRILFSTIADILMSGKKLTNTILLSRLPESVGDLSFEAYTAVLLHNAVAQEVSALDFADDVAEMASRRRLIQISEMLAKAARSNDKSAIDAASDAEAGILDVMQVSSPKRLQRLGDLVDAVVSSSMRAHKDEVLPGYTTGLNAIDEILGRLMPGDLVFILGAQGDGKSSLLGQIAKYVAQYGPVPIFQNEMTEEQAAVRQVAASSGVSVREIREGAFNFAQADMISDAKVSLQAPEMYLMTDPKLTVPMIRAHSMSLKMSRGLAMIGIDQLTHLRSPNKHRDKWSLREEVTSDLKSLALELNVPLICLAQRTRTAQRRDDDTPHIDDADAPSIERDADIVAAVWRKENWLRRNKPSPKAGTEELNNWEVKLNAAAGKADVIALKVRSGKAGEQRSLKWHGPTTTFSDL